MKQTLIPAAICYDFDGTLAPANMQDFGLIPALGHTPNTFWQKSDALATKNNMDKNLAYMLSILQIAKTKNIYLTAETLAEYGASIPLFDGVDTWFSRINAYAFSQGIKLEHFILSSGLKEIMLGTSIAPEFTKIYSCSFLFDENGIAFWPRQIVNYTTKTQYLFRISKGCLDESDTAVNERIPKEARKMPFSNIIYLGDGLTDVPCMSTLKKLGGSALAVYHDNRQTAQNLLHDCRVDNIAYTDYSQGSPIDTIIKHWLNKLKSDTNFRA